MISTEQLKEFGFSDISKFPKILQDHAVTISLPSAMAYQLNPVELVIHKGLAIPVQMRDVPNGMIIRNDGKMVFVAHEKPGDFTTPLKATYTDQIAYDVRAEAFSVMSRAVEVDPSLSGIWLEILSHWVRWYPILLHEIKRQHGGEFLQAGVMIKGLEDFLTSFVQQVRQTERSPFMVPLKIMVQSFDEMAKGWQGEEFCVLETSVGAVLSDTASIFFQEKVLPKLRQILQSPVFYSQSQFRLYFEPRAFPVLKLVIVPPLNAILSNLARGIDL